MGLSGDEQREYDELCRREHTLMDAPVIVDARGRVIDLDGDLESTAERQRQHQ